MMFERIGERLCASAGFRHQQKTAGVFVQPMNEARSFPVFFQRREHRVEMACHIRAALHRQAERLVQGDQRIVFKQDELFKRRRIGGVIRRRFRGCVGSLGQGGYTDFLAGLQAPV